MINYRDENFIKAFGDNLKTIRNNKKLSQEELADVAKLSFNQIGRIERGEVNTTISAVKAIAKALEITPKELFDFE